MAILAVNAGSSSLKVDALDDDRVADSGSVDAPPDGTEAGELLDRMLAAHPDVELVGHRIVHGGPSLVEHAVVDDDIRARLERGRSIDPLHVPPALAALDRCREKLPDATHVACLDTAFHASMGEVARTYAVPAGWRDLGVRRYGFHGISYEWSAARAAELLGSGGRSLVLAHVGGGTSVCAVDAGRSVWTSMGFTSLEGAVMVGRSGSVDPGILLWLQEEHGLGVEDLRAGLQSGGGLTALSGGLGGDTRALVPAAQGGNADARLALDVFTFRLAQEIAAAASCLPRLDALIFTGEIGSDDPWVREQVCDRLAVLGLAGPLPDGEGVLREGPPAVLLVPTAEERQIARICLQLSSS